MKVLRRIASLILCLCAALNFSVRTFAAESLLELLTPPDRTVFYEGTDWGYFNNEIYPFAGFDLSGMKILYEGIEVSYHVFPWGANMSCEPAAGKWQAGNNNVKIFFEDEDNDYIPFTVKLAQIQKVEIVSVPDVTVFIQGKDWDYGDNGQIIPPSINLRGLKLKVTYSDSSTAEIPYRSGDGNITWELRDDSFKVGTTRLNICYSGKKVSLSVRLDEEKIIRASVLKNPDKNIYEFRSEWRYRAGKIIPDIQLDGMSAIAVYNNGKTQEVFYDKEPERFTVVKGQTFSSGQSRCSVLLDSEFEMWFYFGMEMYGDIDGDGEVNSTDALMILRYCVRKTDFDSGQIKYSDVNDDGIINSADALAVLNKAVRLISLFEAEK